MSSSQGGLVRDFLKSRYSRIVVNKSGIDCSKLPDMLEIQCGSYNKLLYGVDGDYKDSGVENVFKSVFPIVDASHRATLDFVSYRLEEPKFNVLECVQRGITYSAVLRANMRLIVWTADEELGKSVKSIKEQEVYVTDVPIMTDKGTFVISGCEYVVVSQMHRSPGVFFDHDGGRNHSSGKILYSARVIPYRGSWLDFEFDGKDLLYLRIDRKRKMYVTTLLYALGMSKQEIIDFFYDKFVLHYDGVRWTISLELRHFIGFTLPFSLIDSKGEELLVKSGVRINQRLINRLSTTGKQISGLFSLDFAGLDSGLLVAYDVTDAESGEQLFESGSVIEVKQLDYLVSTGVKDLSVLVVDDVCAGDYMLNTIKHDKSTTAEEALMEIYKVMRPGEMANQGMASALLHSFFFDKDKYDLSDVGRVKINARLGLDLPEDCGVLTKEDILHVIRMLIAAKDGKVQIDDIDHLGNRRVRSVGELVENQFRVGLVKIGKAVLERFAAVDLNVVMPNELVNSKLLVSLVREFFSASQLSQFMDQTNPLSEITHKRRLSALGPGGLTRERAGYEVRDVHTTYYGRICPIETPEGQNIGLINSLAIYATINKYGFIETPYYRVVDGVRTSEIHYLSAIEEENCYIAQANSKLDASGRFVDEMIYCRYRADFVTVPNAEVNYIDVSPKQVVSVAASLIPFLENDDANRALMGSNMQRQAVPLMRPSAPMVGTGMEYVVAKDSGSVVVARNDGVVRWVDSRRVVIYSEGSADLIDVYDLQKFRSSNYDTNIGHVPCVSKGDMVHAGDIIADSTATKNGELALGKNVLVAFMMMSGLNFEDSILVSERLLHKDVFTSIHIEEFECVARDTRLGPEEITRDIPNISGIKIAHLDESGVVNIGVEVGPGDILAGKITPKNESPMTPEEKLLRTIFGERASDVRDSSLYVPAGVYGTVVDVRIFSVPGLERDQRSRLIEQEYINKIRKNYEVQVAIIDEQFFARLRTALMDKELPVDVLNYVAGTRVTDVFFEGLLALYHKPSQSSSSLKEVLDTIWNIKFSDPEVVGVVTALKSKYDSLIARVTNAMKDEVSRLSIDSDLPQGVLRIVKISLAVKYKLQPGDKMAGRHGNKGVVSRIMPVADMPHLEDGTSIDIVLNPLGVPSRMNVGQILETHMGWLCGKVGRKISDVADQISDGEVDELRSTVRKIFSKNPASQELENMSDDDIVILAGELSKGMMVAVPVFESSTESEVEQFAREMGIDNLGPVPLIDGLTGEYFDRPVTVGYMYIMKLHHLVDNKIHARSVGPYSLITQQPLGGKSHFGGQRFGEMEGWGLQAYGASYTLQEMLTVKSDDVIGRVKMYESIIRGVNELECSIPESFNVMIKELSSLGLDVEFQGSSD